jgi:F420-non-reducing hydrogenase large subunit
MAIRAYDPCVSCATHGLDGKLMVSVNIVGPDGKLIENFRN